jgi:putative nucleotidyltransferase with HDIG domain
VLLDHVIAQLGVDAASILLGDPQTRQLRLGAAKGFRSAPSGDQAQAAWSAGPASRAAFERCTIQANRVDLPPENGTLAALWNVEGFETCFASPLQAKHQVLGVLGVFTRSRLEPDAEWIDFLETLAGQAAIAVENADLVQGLQNANQELLDAYDTTLTGWVQALDLRDKETEEHTRRVTEMTLRLARRMGIDEAQLIHIRRGALLHDIGKVGIPDGILLKPGPLTPAERETMRKHPVYAHQLLSGIQYLHQAMDIPYYHHERWDGTGYPSGLKGEAIPLAARIFAVVDVWDALSSDRPYRSRWDKDKVLDHIRAQSGHHFDPKVVEAFLKLIEA